MALELFSEPQSIIWNFFTIFFFLCRLWRDGYLNHLPTGDPAAWISCLWAALYFALLPCLQLLEVGKPIMQISCKAEGNRVSWVSEKKAPEADLYYSFKIKWLIGFRYSFAFWFHSLGNYLTSSGVLCWLYKICSHGYNKNEWLNANHLKDSKKIYFYHCNFGVVSTGISLWKCWVLAKCLMSVSNT